MEVGVEACDAVGPEDKGRAVDAGSPPARTAVGRHGAQETQDLATVEDGLLAVVDAALVAQAQLPVGAVEAVATGKTLNLWEVGDGVKGDEVVEDQVAARSRAVGVALVV